MALKIYMLSAEIAPFAQQSQLATFMNNLPPYIQENDHDIRLIMPKYGFISSRKYVLREVIRLRDIEAKWRTEVITGNVRSAFVPETKVQVYFLDLPAYFEDVSHLLYKAKNGRPLKDNTERFGLFSKIALRTLEKLFWQPEVVIANDWASAFAIVLQKRLFAREEFFAESKAILALHSVEELASFTPDVLFDAGVDPDSIGLDLDDDTRLIDVAAAVADEVVLVNSPEINMEKLAKEDEQLSEVLAGRDSAPKVLSWEEDTGEAWGNLADQFEIVLQETVEQE
ncbi:MAG: glycogen/starch synthase [Candidatus Marinimicrobia bacterium]|nr:glycogen/starch synthase [Candidatus Neomarinimicrobiota bacterium]MCF7827687.1 glycogen/starch synthase [Candidatus Neomarinimicrobiota bacterium]MCF7881258.1 glycogen/starch synthase [Candidatus Neomarinimicrobiota bacterium]